MKNIKAIIGVLLVFILGATCGALISHIVYRSHHEAFIKGGGEAREELIVRKLTHRLDLDQRQQEQVKAIIHENHAAIQEIRKQARPRIEALLEQGQSRINEVLRPEQQEKFQKIISERKQRRQRGME